LIRRGIVAQIVVGILVVVVVLLMLARSLSLVAEQEDQTRAIREIRNATVSLLGVVGAIDAYSNSGKVEDRQRYESSIEALKAKFLDASTRLEGESAKRAAQAVTDIERWDREVLSKVVAEVEAGNRRAAQQILISAENDAAIGAAGLTIADLLNAQVVDQLETDRDTRTFSIGVTIGAIIGGALLVLAASLYLLRVQRFVVPPLEDLQSTASRIGSGDLGARTTEQGTVETSAAAASFNSMADRVEHSIDELRELDTLKDEFVAAVSHELRTPITTIRAYVDMNLVGETGAMPAEQRESLEVIARSANELAELIDDLLTLTNIEAGRERAVHMHTVDLSELIEEVSNEQKAALEADGIGLELEIAERLFVRADRLRVRQILTNLLSNARKFSTAGMTVKVAATPEAGHVMVSVADEGIGISSHDLPHIGERFYRAKAVRDVPGTGLGLAIVRELVALHGGRLEVASELGAGSTFSFRLPLAADESA
jgi:signal transduction histidine kinase